MLRPIFELRYRDAENALREIAVRLRNGDVDQRFLDHLADHLDPDCLRTISGTKLVAHRIGGSGAPLARPDYDLAHFLELHIDFFEQSAEAVYAEAKARFGASRSKCAEVLREARQTYLDDAHRQMHKDTALRLREHGHPEYQLLWPVSK